MANKYTCDEITKLLNTLVGRTVPVADSAIDEKIEENLKTLIDIVNWCLGGMYYSARYRKSQYGSARDIGERAYSAMLEWKEWLEEKEEELA